MITFDYLLSILHEIQGAADPNHPEGSLKDRMQEVYEKTSDVMKTSGWTPEE